MGCSQANPFSMRAPRNRALAWPEIYPMRPPPSVALTDASCVDHCEAGATDVGDHPVDMQARNLCRALRSRRPCGGQALQAPGYQIEFRCGERRAREVHHKRVARPQVDQVEHPRARRVRKDGPAGRSRRSGGRNAERSSSGCPKSCFPDCPCTTEPPAGSRSQRKEAGSEPDGCWKSRTARRTNGSRRGKRLFTGISSGLAACEVTVRARGSSPSLRGHPSSGIRAIS